MSLVRHMGLKHMLHRIGHPTWLCPHCNQPEKVVYVSIECNRQEGVKGFRDTKEGKNSLHSLSGDY